LQSNGSLNDTDLRTLLESAQSERATGTLTVRNGTGGACTLYFLFGPLFHALGDGTQGDDAVVKARGWSTGEFDCDAKAKLPADETVSLESVSLVKPLVLSRRRGKRQLMERLESHDFDLVHASFWFSSLDFDLPKTCRRLGIPIVATFHVAFDTRFSVWGGITAATYRLYAPALSSCDRVIVFGGSQLESAGAYSR